MRNAEERIESSAITLQIKADCTVREIHNFWNHIHFHPTDAIEDEWGRSILGQVSHDGVARYVRIYAMLEDIVGRDREGKLTYDFRDTDCRLDYLIEKGFKLLICFNFLPRAIASDPECMSWLPRYKGKYINTSKPADYREWQEVCRVYTEHLRERYGEEKLSEWYFHCWNEPDFPEYFLSDVSREDHNLILAAEEYEKLYDHFAEGVGKACNTVKIGGPSAALSNKFIEHFLQHVKEGINWANEDRGTRFDFLSIHTYGAFPIDLAAGKQIRIEDTYKRVKELESLAVQCGIVKPEIIVDEWGLSTEGFTDAEKCPVLEFRNTELYAAAYAHLIHYYTKKQAPVKLQMICLSGQHNLKREFHGYRSFFTLHGLPKPIYNAYALCAKLGNRLLESVDCLESENNRDGNGTMYTDLQKEQDGSSTGVFPTADEKGRIAILLYRFSPDAVTEVQKLRTGTACLLHLQVSGLQGRWRVRHYRIDREHSNSYTAWRRLGGKDDLNQLECEWIRKKGRLELLYPEEFLEIDGKWQQDIVMTDNSVSLIELEPVTGKERG